MKPNSNYRTICLITLALLVAGAFIAVPALALKVEGARIALDVEPGKSYTSPIGISISPDESEGTFAIDVMGFGQSPEEGTYTALDASADTSSYSARSFITIDKPIVTLRPGERADVTATITIPSGTRDGGRYAIILVHPAASVSGAPAAFATAVAIPVFLTIKSGTITETGEILTLEPTTVEAGKPFTVITNFRNSGNYHYYGIVNNVTVTNTQGNLVAAVKTDPFIRAIVPGQSVKFTGTISNDLPRGTYEIAARMETQDGNILAEKNAALQVGTSAPAQTTTPTPTTIPGFGALIAFTGISVALYGTLRFRKGGEGR